MNYRIDRSRGNWVVQRRHVHTSRSSTPGRVEWQTQSYHGDRLDMAAKKMLQLAIADGYPYATTEIEALIDAVEQAYEDVETTLASLEYLQPSESDD